MDDSGNFLAVWLADDVNYHIEGQWFDSSGTRIGSEFQISETVAFLNREPSVDINASGDAIVSWSKQSGTGAPIMARTVASLGGALGSEFYTGIQGPIGTVSKAAISDTGDFIVVGSNTGGVYARRWDGTAFTYLAGDGIPDSTITTTLNLSGTVA